MGRFFRIRPGNPRGAENGGCVIVLAGSGNTGLFYKFVNVNDMWFFQKGKEKNPARNDCYNRAKEYVLFEETRGNPGEGAGKKTHPVDTGL